MSIIKKAWRGLAGAAVAAVLLTGLVSGTADAATGGGCTAAPTNTIRACVSMIGGWYVFDAYVPTGLSTVNCMITFQSVVSGPGGLRNQSGGSYSCKPGRKGGSVTAAAGSYYAYTKLTVVWGCGVAATCKRTVLSPAVINN